MFGLSFFAPTDFVLVYNGRGICINQQLFNGGKFVTLTEGEVDAMSVYQMLGSKYPVVSIKNGVASALKDVKKSYTWLDKFDNIVINFDNDEVGREAAYKVAIYFNPGKLR